MKVTVKIAAAECPIPEFFRALSGKYPGSRLRHNPEYSLSRIRDIFRALKNPGWDSCGRISPKKIKNKTALWLFIFVLLKLV